MSAAIKRDGITYTAHAEKGLLSLRVEQNGATAQRIVIDADAWPAICQAVALVRNEDLIERQLAELTADFDGGPSRG